MTTSHDFDDLITAWLADEAPLREPDDLALLALARTRHTRQMAGPGRLERWHPMAVLTAPRAASIPVRMAWLVLITLLVLAIAAGGFIAGSHLLGTTPPTPVGGAAVLAFDSNGDLFTIRADGNDRHQLTDGPERDAVPVWSPDGTRIAFRRTDADGTSVAVTDAGGGTPRTLFHSASPAGGECVPHAPAWSPDSDWLVFPDDDCARFTDLYVASADNRSAARTFLAPGMVGTAPAWSAGPGDGPSIAFVGKDAEGEGIFVARVEAGIDAQPPISAFRISDPDPSLHWAESGWAPLAAPSWSPDGLWVAAAAGTTTNCIYATTGTMDAFVIKVWRPGQSAMAAGDAKEYNPIWSPDGQTIAFQRIVDPSEYIDNRPCTMAVWIADVVDMGVTNERQLSVRTTDDAQPPLWSPDGTRIVGNTIHVRDGVEHGDLYIETIDGISPPVYVEDVGYATWQPIAAPLGPATSAAAP
jgi:dipeptidyl aminopeptidase/acylaminoacyl peptidase